MLYYAYMCVCVLIYISFCSMERKAEILAVGEAKKSRSKDKIPKSQRFHECSYTQL